MLKRMQARRLSIFGVAGELRVADYSVLEPILVRDDDSIPDDGRRKFATTEVDHFKAKPPNITGER